jgi:hypothetical protein
MKTDRFTKQQLDLMGVRMNDMLMKMDNYLTEMEILDHVIAIVVEVEQVQIIAEEVMLVHLKLKELNIFSSILVKVKNYSIQGHRPVKVKVWVLVKVQPRRLIGIFNS